MNHKFPKRMNSKEDIFKKIKENIPESRNISQSYSYIKEIERCSEEVKKNLGQTPRLKVPYLLHKPVKMFKDDVYQYGIEFLTEKNDKYEPEVRQAIAMRVVCAAQLLNKENDLYETKIIQKLASSEPSIFGLPCLMLAAFTVIPDTNSYVEPRGQRQISQFYFYQGVNRLYLSQFKTAKKLFIQALTVGKDNDVLYGAFQHLSIVCFLLGDSKAILDHYCPPAVFLEGAAKMIWENDTRLNPESFEDVAKLFKEQIMVERAKRVLIDFAQTCTKVPLLLVEKACAGFFQDAVMKILETGEFEITVTDDVVTFAECELSSSIMKQSVRLAKLRELMLGERNGGKLL